MLYDEWKNYQNYWYCGYRNWVWSEYPYDWVNEKKMDERIEEKVNEALAKRDSENEEES